MKNIVLSVVLLTLFSINSWAYTPTPEWCEHTSRDDPHQGNWYTLVKALKSKGTHGDTSSDIMVEQGDIISDEEISDGESSAATGQH